jgi:hypothetical protein
MVQARRSRRCDVELASGPGEVLLAHHRSSTVVDRSSSVAMWDDY